MEDDAVAVLTAVVIVVIWVAILVTGVRVAKRKGRSPHWMWFGIHPLTGLGALVGLLLARPLPRCPRCGAHLPAGVGECPTCRHDLAEPAAGGHGAGAPGETVWASGKFRKVRFKALGTAGRYRGRGQLAVGEEGLTITGRHVYPLGSRWAMAVGIFVGILLLSLASTSGSYLLLVGPLPLYLFVEFLWLKREQVQVPWADVTRFTTDPAQALVAIEFQGPRGTSPIVLAGGQWPEVRAWLRQRVPQGEIPAAPGTARSQGLVVALVVLVAVMVLGIVAAIAIPSLLEARRRAEEGRLARPVPAEELPQPAPMEGLPPQ